MTPRVPPAEVRIDERLVRALLAEQHPGLAGEPLTLLGEGWDNVTWRLGRARAVRLPRRAAAVPSVRNELRWLPELAERLPVAVPRPVASGTPSALFPWPWSVVAWLPGVTADREALRPDQAPRLAEALRALHRPAPPEAPENPWRGVPLAARRETVEARLGDPDLAPLEGIWRAALEAAQPAGRRWVHGDLHPRNVLVRAGELAGILDWGDLTAGDAALDLACGWMLFEPRAREAFLEAYGATEEERARAAGWATFFATVLIESGEPAHARIGRRAVRELVAVVPAS